MAKQEYEGVAFSSGIKDGWQVSVTERAESSAEAVANLEGTIEVMKAEGYTPFVSYTNKAELVDVITPRTVVEEAVALGGKVIADAFESGDGTRYLGIKPGKLESILENDSYDVPAQFYSYDGTWVNFFNGQQDAASYYYAHKKSAEIFRGMFGWSPEFEDKALLPNGDVTLYIVGVNNKGTVYQNIKKVT